MLTALTLFIALFIFLGFSITSFILIFFARKIHGKRFSISWFVLALGNVLLGWSYFFLIITTENFNLNIMNASFVITSMFFIILGSILVFQEKSAEISSLKSRYDELESILEYLKSKYMRREITEEELKDLHKEFMKEMSEVDVKLKKLNKEGEGHFN